MPRQLEHPADAVLADFLVGKLPNRDDADVERHLAECPQCEARAATVSSSDTLVSLLAAAGSRLLAERSSAMTPAPEGALTPPAFAPTLAFDESRPPMNDPAIPAALANHPRYRVQRQLGVGGMGTVWLAEHAVMNRPVAVKVIRPDLLARPGAADRFLREVRAAAKLHHPNIVTAFDAEVVGDSCLLAMEYVPGETLGDRVQTGPLPVAEACRAARDVARGLAHAHAAGLVHRDVKPHNLMRTADGTTKVLDFGLAGIRTGEAIPAAANDGLTGAGMLCGTPDYIAPEQSTDPRAADPRADIYGLGCTLYHLLAGRAPFAAAASVNDKLTAQRESTPEPIAGLPPPLWAVLAKMMAKRPEDRYQTADEVAAALEPFSATSNRAATAGRRRRVRRLTAIAAGLLAAGILVAAGVILTIERDKEIIKISTNDSDVRVEMRRNGEVVRVHDDRTGETWVIDTASNQISQADRDDGLKLSLPENRAIVLKRKGKDVFTVTRLTAQASDNQLILGTWQGVSAEFGGQQMPREIIDTIKPTLTFTPEKVISKPQGTFPKAVLDMVIAQGILPKNAASVVENGVEGVYHLDPTKSPGQIDLTMLGEVRKNALGIYRLEGDTLTICVSVDPDKVAERPKEFASKAGDKFVMITARRQTVAKRTDPPSKPRPMPDKLAAATKAADAWLKLIDDGKYADAWEHSDSVAKQRTPKEDFVRAYEKRAQELGKQKSREFRSGTSRGEMVSISYTSSFENLNEATESLSMKRDVDGDWHMLGHLPPRARPAAARPDHELIQGKWQAISGERDGGIVLKPEELKEMTMTFAGETATVTQPGARHSGTFTLDQTKKPKQITVTADESEKFRGNFGIYSLEGDTLKICMSDARMGRPTEFKSRVGDKLCINVVFKRVATDRPPPAAKP
ncbi:MAG: protein kinase domain-containing protein [Gemmataceae bacterium]